MNRKLKNIICILIILIMGGLVYFTISHVNDYFVSSNEMGSMNDPLMNMTGDNGQEPPEKPDEDDKQMGEASEKPDNNDNQDNNMENEMGEPPEKPDEDDKQMGEASEKPDNNDNQDNNMENEMGEPPEKPDGDNKQMMGMANSNLSGWYYVIVGASLLIIFGVIIYMIMSNFNKKNIKETFINKDKVIIYVLSMIICGCSFTYLSGIVTSKYFVNNSKNDFISNNSNVSYKGVKEIKEDMTISTGDYSSNGADENAILVSGAVNVSLDNISVNKTGETAGGDNASFYGMNSAILAKDGANLTINNATINTDATGGNGVFSYVGSATTDNTTSDGTTVTISNSKITTNKDNSGGIMTTGGGKMIANNLEINTSGVSSAAIRTDRGGGTVLVTGGTYMTNGKGSPAIYSTAEISVKEATLLSLASEGIVIEGKNSVTLDNVTLDDNNTSLNGKSTTYKNIFLYQSMSGDATNGEALFKATNSKITTNKGDTFYITNTEATIELENNTIVNNDSAGYFLRSKSDSWGNSNDNGGIVTLKMTKQKARGNIYIDNISTLKMVMANNSYYEGVINSENVAKEINLVLDKTSSIKLMGDSYITSLDNDDSNNSNIDFNGYKLYVGGVAIN